MLDALQAPALACFAATLPGKSRSAPHSRQLEYIGGSAGAGGLQRPGFSIVPAATERTHRRDGRH